MHKNSRVKSNNDLISVSLTTTSIIDSMPNFTRGAIVLEGNLPFGADFYYAIVDFAIMG